MRKCGYKIILYNMESRLPGKHGLSQFCCYNDLNTLYTWGIIYGI